MSTVAQIPYFRDAALMALVEPNPDLRYPLLDHPAVKETRAQSGLSEEQAEIVYCCALAAYTRSNVCRDERSRLWVPCITNGKTNPAQPEKQPLYASPRRGTYKQTATPPDFSLTLVQPSALLHALPQPQTDQFFTFILSLLHSFNLYPISPFSDLHNPSGFFSKFSLAQVQAAVPLIDSIYNQSFTGHGGHLIGKRRAAAYYLNLPLEHGLVDCYWAFLEYRLGSTEASSYRASLD